TRPLAGDGLPHAGPPVPGARGECAFARGGAGGGRADGACFGRAARGRGRRGSLGATRGVARPGRRGRIKRGIGRRRGYPACTPDSRTAKGIEILAVRRGTASRKPAPRLSPLGRG